MDKAANVFLRIEPELKAEADVIFNQIGLTTPKAVEVFLRQVVMRKGLPFDLCIPAKPMALSDMTQEQLDAELEAGYQAILAGRTMSEAEMEARFQNGTRAWTMQRPTRNPRWTT